MGIAANALMQRRAVFDPKIFTSATAYLWWTARRCPRFAVYLDVPGDADVDTLRNRAGFNIDVKKMEA